MNPYNTEIQNAKTAQEACQIFERAIKDPRVKLGGAFFHGVLCKLGNDDENHVAQATRVYHAMKHRNIDLRTKNINRLIFICTKVGDLAQASFFMSEFEKAAKSGVLPNAETTNHFISGCVNFGQYEKAYQLLLISEESGLIDDYTQKHYNHLFRKHVAEKNLEQAQKVSAVAKKGVLKLDRISFNQLIDFHANQGDTAQATRAYHEMTRAQINPDLVIFNTLMKAGVIARNSHYVQQIFLEMQRQGINPDANMHKHCWKIVKSERKKPAEETLKKRSWAFYQTCERIDNLSQIALSNPAGYRKMQLSRVEGSTTIGRDSQAMIKWEKADEKVRRMASKKIPLTLDEIRNIQRSLGGTGQFRTKGEEVTAGGSLGYLYAPGEKVSQEMVSFHTWLVTNIERCDAGTANPIEVAARAYQSLVSIHPFPNENGRTSRLVMDYILQRYGLPPAALGKDIKVAIFSFSPSGTNPSTAAECVLKGVQESYRLLGMAPVRG